jgi:hypothetical protein
MSETINCILCGKCLTFGGIGYITNDGAAVHGECIEEHCPETNCFGCNIGKYPDCVFLDMKVNLMKAGDSK